MKTAATLTPTLLCDAGTVPVNYYNEIDPFAAAWLRELIKANIIAPGEVDERSICDVQPGDLRSYTQCHFFAGIGVWSYALRCAGWPDDAAVWTGSCPCQSFSASGKRRGFSDQRHLWPAWFRLIRECRPDVCFGEQVASNDGLAWFDVVSSDLEGAGYAVGPSDTCAAGFGAPHRRQRLYFVAESQHAERWALNLDGQDGRDGSDGGRQEAHGESGTRGQVRGVARFEQCDAGQRGIQESDQGGAIGELGNAALSAEWPLNGQSGASGKQQQPTGRSSIPSDLGNTRKPRLEKRQCEPGNDGQELAPIERAGPTNGFWADAEWIPCRGKIPGTIDWRPIKPGTFALAHGSPRRVGRLRGYGNAICAPQAEAFIRAYLQILKAMIVAEA